MSATKKTKIKVLIVDDHPVVRKGLWSCLSTKENLKVVGEAGEGDDAIRRVRGLFRDIGLMALHMPGKDGLEVPDALRREAPQVRVLILSRQGTRDSVLRIIKAGAGGYLLK